MKFKKTIVAMLMIALCILSVAATPLTAERQNIDGVEYIVKTFSLAVGEDAEILSEPDFEDDGFSFSLHTTTAEEQITEVNKVVNVAVANESDSGELSEVLKLFAPSVEYDQDGYVGTLTLDATTVVTEVSEYKTTSRIVSDTREFVGMTYADPSALPQSVVKDGATLPLTDVNWTVVGTDLVGDSLVPTEYKATATYSKSVSGSVPYKYTSTANYSGEVISRTVDGVLHTLTYIGTPIVAEQPEPEPVPVKSFPMWIIFTILGVVVAGGAAAAVYIILSRRNAYRYYGGGQ